MIDALKKKLGVGADKQEGDGLVVNAETQATIDTLTKATSAALADLAAAEQLLTEQTATIASLTEQLSKANEALAAVEATKEAVILAAKETKAAARKTAVVAAVGEAKAEALLLATETLDDAAFEAVTQALVGKAAAEASTPLFKEVGVEAQADASQATEESAEMRLLKAKYPKAA